MIIPPPKDVCNDTLLPANIRLPNPPVFAPGNAGAQLFRTDGFSTAKPRRSVEWESRPYGIRQQDHGKTVAKAQTIAEFGTNGNSSPAASQPGQPSCRDGATHTSGIGLIASRGQPARAFHPSNRRDKLPRGANLGYRRI